MIGGASRAVLRKNQAGSRQPKLETPIRVLQTGLGYEIDLSAPLLRVLALFCVLPLSRSPR